MPTPCATSRSAAPTCSRCTSGGIPASGCGCTGGGATRMRRRPAPAACSRRRPPKTMADPSRIVVRAPNWLGDAVMALPAMAAIRRGLEGRTLIVAARASIAPIFHERTEAAPDEVLALEADREAEQLRGVRADAIVLLPNSFGSAWTARRAGIAERWGF